MARKVTVKKAAVAKAAKVSTARRVARPQRTSVARASRVPRTINVRDNAAQGMTKGDFALPKDNKKWLYIGGAIVLLLIILYFATGGQLFAGLDVYMHILR